MYVIFNRLLLLTAPPTSINLPLVTSNDMLEGELRLFFPQPSHREIVLEGENPVQYVGSSAPLISGIHELEPITNQALF